MTLFQLENISTTLTGILFVALPFVVCGVVVSKIIERYISRERLIALYGTNFFQNYAVSIALGFMFPICECGIVPIAHALSKKGISNSAIVMFLLSAPIFNPITLFATATAFSAHPHVWIMRLLISQILTLSLGFVFQTFTDAKNKPLPLLRAQKNHTHACCETTSRASMTSFCKSVFHEFQIILPYILLGAFLTSLFQIFIPKEIIIALATSPFLAIMVGLALALVLSVCSSVDAFVILPLANQLPFAAIIAFLNYGPLIDIKNILLFRTYFTARFSYWYFGLVSISLFLLCCIIWFLFPQTSLV